MITPAREYWTKAVDTVTDTWNYFREVSRTRFFSFLDVFSPCVTYNHYHTFQWLRPRVKKPEDGAAYDPADWMAAMGKSLFGEEIPIGKFFERTDVPILHAAEPVLNGGPLVHADARIPLEVTRSLVEELM
jgi:2-oxoglutarate/2-oxoacid ferredoxin oxidoreductase subunit beta